jgi:hypothetical protein
VRGITCPSLTLQVGKLILPDGKAIESTARKVSGEHNEAKAMRVLPDERFVSAPARYALISKPPSVGSVACDCYKRDSIAARIPVERGFNQELAKRWVEIRKRLKP